jgi:hypothetical protein
MFIKQIKCGTLYPVMVSVHSDKYGWRYLIGTMDGTTLRYTSAQIFVELSNLKAKGPLCLAFLKNEIRYIHPSYVQDTPGYFVSADPFAPMFENHYWIFPRYFGDDFELLDQPSTNAEGLSFLKEGV